MNATNFLSDTQRAEVERAIADVEKRTAAEFLCAVATESGRYDRAESIVGLVGALLGLGVVNVVASGAVAPSGSWSAPQSLAIGWQALAVVIGFIVGSIASSYWHGLRRLVVSRREMQVETERAASHVFAQRRLSSTRKRGGVLVYVSIFERLIVVLTDEGVLQAAGQRFAQELRDQAVACLRENKRVETFTDTVRIGAERLESLLAVEKDDVNELSNRLLTFHPRP